MTGDRARGGARVWLVVMLVVVTGAGGVVLGMLVLPLGLDTDFRRAFFTSAGFGGLAAVAAAIVAYSAARHTARSTREESQLRRQQVEWQERKSQWWARAEWAITQIAAGGKRTTIGVRVLEALGDSEWAEEHEANIATAAMAFALESARLTGAEVEAEAGGSDSFGGSTSPRGSGKLDRGGDDG